MPLADAQSRRDAILKRPESDPLVLHTQSATEYWQRRGSLVHTDTESRDLEPPDGVRIYLWASSQHFADPSALQPARGNYQHYGNVVQTSMLFRAILDALDAWATHGTEPPASRIPRRADGTLVEFEAWKSQFPRISGVMIPSGANSLPFLRLRTRTSRAGCSPKSLRIWQTPAATRFSCPPWTPTATTSRGCGRRWSRARSAPARAGICAPAASVMAPCTSSPGSYIPFPDTDSEAAMTGDPRASVLARYRDADGYQRAIEAAARRLVDERLMLAEDVERVVERARDWGRPLHGVRL